MVQFVFQDSIIEETQQLMNTKKHKLSHSSVGILFSTLLTNYYSKKEVCLTTLFKFHLWPEYLKHFGK